MAWKPCRECGYWVEAPAPHCPNCGLRKPHVPKAKLEAVGLGWVCAGLGVGALGGLLLALLPGKELATQVGNDAARGLGVLLGAAGGGGFGVLLGQLYTEQNEIEPKLKREEAQLLGGVLGAILGALLGHHLGQEMVRAGTGAAIGTILLVLIAALIGSLLGAVVAGAWGKLAFGRARCHLRELERATRTRLEALAEQEPRLTAERERLRRTCGREDPRHQALSGLAETLERVRDQDTARLWRIELFRWANTLHPLTGNLDGLTPTDCAARLEVLRAEQERGEALIRGWREERTGRSPEGQACLVDLRRALNAAEQLRQGLVAREALLTIQGATAPGPDAPDTALLAEATAGLAELTARAEVGQLTAAFASLDEVYARLMAEAEVAALSAGPAPTRQEARSRRRSR